MRIAGKIAGVMIFGSVGLSRAIYSASFYPERNYYLNLIGYVILGLILGALFDDKLEHSLKGSGIGDWEDAEKNRKWWKWWKAEYNRTKWKDEFKAEESKKAKEQQAAELSFSRALAILAAAVAQADGAVGEKEAYRVRRYFTERLGYQAAEEWVKIFDYQALQTVDLKGFCAGIKRELSYAVRLHLYAILGEIAGSDSKISDSEREVLEEIAEGLGLEAGDKTTIGGVSFTPEAGAYAVLGVKKSDRDTDIKSAYHRLVLQYHPDKVAHLGEKYVKIAEERFKRIQDAYDEIKQERGVI